jgi:hypothetical protein
MLSSIRGTNRVRRFNYLSPEEASGSEAPIAANTADDGLKAFVAMVQPSLFGLRADHRSHRRSYGDHLLLQAMYTVRSKRMLMEQLEYNLPRADRNLIFPAVQSV